MKFRKRTAPTPSEPTSSPVAPGDYGLVSYSQEGEDMVLRRFTNKDKGFYVDIGAHHPERFSNTLYYYKLGWRGLNVDADPDLMTDFEEARPNDINVTAAIGNSDKPLTFYVFNERAINTFDHKLAKERTKVKGWEIIAERKIPIISLTQLFKKHLPHQQHIDFLAVDVEGHDLEVLKSNDWSKYRPDFILVEAYGVTELLKLNKDPIVKYLAEQDYVPIAGTYYTIIFANKQTYDKH